MFISVTPTLSSSLSPSKSFDHRITAKRCRAVRFTKVFHVTPAFIIFLSSANAWPSVSGKPTVKL